MLQSTEIKHARLKSKSSCRWVVRRLGANLEKELDFGIEAQNALRLQKYMANNPCIAVPESVARVRHKSSENFMDRLPGKAILTLYGFQLTLDSAEVSTYGFMYLELFSQKSHEIVLWCSIDCTENLPDLHLCVAVLYPASTDNGMGGRCQTEQPQGNGRLGHTAQGSCHTTAQSFWPDDLHTWLCACRQASQIRRVA